MTKKLKMNHLGLYTLHNMAPALTAATATECDKKKKQKTKGQCQLLNFEIHELDKAIKIFEKFRVNVKL